jgi:putative toxin-antitoxin system antitoxin component (TIGR02293 family)
MATTETRAVQPARRTVKTSRSKSEAAPDTPASTEAPTRPTFRATFLRSDRQKSTESSVERSAYGYTSLLGLEGNLDGRALVERVRKGLPYRAFDRFIANTQLTTSDAAELINVPTRTLARRKTEGRFQPDESDRLLRASRVLNRAIHLFEGDRIEAAHWLSRSSRALGGATPIDLARTEVGAIEVERLIDKLEFGVIV